MTIAHGHALQLATSHANFRNQWLTMQQEDMQILITEFSGKSEIQSEQMNISWALV